MVSSTQCVAEPDEEIGSIYRAYALSHRSRTDDHHKSIVGRIPRNVLADFSVMVHTNTSICTARHQDRVKRAELVLVHNEYSFVVVIGTDERDGCITAHTTWPGGVRISHESFLHPIFWPLLQDIDICTVNSVLTAFQHFKAQVGVDLQTWLMKRVDVDLIPTQHTDISVRTCCHTDFVIWRLHRADDWRLLMEAVRSAQRVNDGVMCLEVVTVELRTLRATHECVHGMVWYDGAGSCPLGWCTHPWRRSCQKTIAAVLSATYCDESDRC